MSKYFVLGLFFGIFLYFSPLYAQPDGQKGSGNITSVKDDKKEDKVKQLEKLKKRLQHQQRELRMKLRSLGHILRKYRGKMGRNKWQSLAKRARFILESFLREVRRAGAKKALSKLGKYLLRSLMKRRNRLVPRNKGNKFVPQRVRPKVTPEMNARIYYTKGVIAMNKKDFSLAMENLNKAIAINPGEGAYYFTRGNILLFQKKYNRARKDYLKAITLKPNLSSAYYNIACLYALQKNKTEALNWLKKAIHHGFKDLDHMKVDPDLKILHGNENFKKLFQKKWK